MIYAIADLHGYPLEKLQALLQTAAFSEEDFLYILGDVVDRNGDGGAAMLGWLLEQPNVQLILGNHEAMLLSCRFVLEEITEASIDALTADKLGLLSSYMEAGGDVTLKALRQLQRVSPDKVQDILDYLQEAPLYEGITAGGQDFLLVHAGIEHFEPGKKLSQYEDDQFLWARPTLQEEYFDDIITVLGHTPTALYGEAHRGQIVKTRTWIDIDVGAGFGEEPVLLRLDDFAEFRGQPGKPGQAGCENNS